jgi:hypothetical protein
MAATKPLHLCLAGLAAGLALSYLGAGNYVQSSKLVNQHDSVEGIVTDVQKESRHRNRSQRYFVRVDFVTKQGEPVSKVFDSILPTSVGKQVTIYYHPPDPTNATMNVRPALETSVLAVGLFLLGFAAFMGFRHKKEARATAQSLASGYLPRLDYAPADAKKFTQLDLAFYESNQRLLEQHGFTLVCDEEHIPSRRSAIKVFVRVMRGPDGTAMAHIYHMKPPFSLRLLGALRSRPRSGPSG